jgi:hypothetical protein
MRSMTRLLFAAPLGFAAFAWANTSHAQITGFKNDDVPVAQAQRQLVLPDMTLAPRFDTTFDHIEGFGGAANGASLELGAQFGLLGDIELEATVISLYVGEIAVSPITIVDDPGSIGVGGFQSGADWGVSRFGGTVRFFANDVAEIGGRFRFSVDNNAYIGLEFGLPVRIHLGDVARLDTGLFMHPVFPTSGGDPLFGLRDIDDNALRPSPGIPLELVVNPIEQLWLNISTGFAVTDVTEDQSIYLPLEMGIGGTIASGKRALVDIGANFAFPILFTPGSDDKATTNIWQVGLGAKVFLPVK